MKIKYLMIFMVLFLVSCTTQKTVSVPYAVFPEVQPVERPDALLMKPVNYYVLSEFDNSINDFKNEFNNSYVFVAMKIKDYENLAMNIQDIIAYIKKQKAIIEYYENTITKEDRDK